MGADVCEAVDLILPLACEDEGLVEAALEEGAREGRARDAEAAAVGDGAPCSGQDGGGGGPGQGSLGLGDLRLGDRGLRAQLRVGVLVVLLAEEHEAVAGAQLVDAGVELVEVGLDPGAQVRIGLLEGGRPEAARQALGASR